METIHGSVGWRAAHMQGSHGGGSGRLPDCEGSVCPRKTLVVFWILFICNTLRDVKHFNPENDRNPRF